MIRHGELIALLLGGAHAAERPNILWLTAEDMSPNMGCYGDDQALTPRFDELVACSKDQFTLLIAVALMISCFRFLPNSRIFLLVELP